MQSTSIRIYVGLVTALAVVSLAFVDWASLAPLGDSVWTGLLSLIILGLVSESLSLKVKVAGNQGSSSITFLPLLACVLLFGPVPALIFLATTGVFGELVIRRNEPIKATFNISQYLLSTAVAGLVFTALGGVPQAIAEGPLHWEDMQIQGWELIAFGLVFLTVNQSAVAIAIAVSERLPFSKVWALVVGRSGANVFYDLLISPVAIGMGVAVGATGVGVSNMAGAVGAGLSGSTFPG
ncbi:MAG: hypothetical protein IIB37_03440 [Gemmatimonadetes bacterium]|nr:hypothetical protein [Gemmatimonadota bacterium]